MTDRHIWIFGRYFLESEQSETIISWKTMKFVVNDEFELQSKNQNFGKLVATFISSTTSQTLQDF